ncbi:hypothetical protein [Amycolatopsis pithecellobii]|uniref:Uncharacterized protein n=1 Tax=Amycolatopsis pithecellobii TaxID=664692 RepID=A0A6N7ZA63_9PSEU|nr:hypothetical protein [Amycolatopsis pithecellobii]MTD58622.1 hypothetical protein [Amycolatopsis pithecellobii]
MTAADFPPRGCLGELLDQWRRDICSVPIPRLVDLPTAVAIVCAAREQLELKPAGPGE